MDKNGRLTQIIAILVIVVIIIGIYVVKNGGNEELQGAIDTSRGIAQEGIVPLEISSFTPEMITESDKPMIIVLGESWCQPCLRMMDDLYRWIDISMSSMTFSELSDLARDMRHFSMLVKNSKYVPLETNIMENLGLTLKIIKSLFTVYVTIPPAEKKEILGNMIDFVKKSGRNTDIGSINTIFSQNAAYLASKIRENGFKMKEAEEIDETLSMAYSHGFRPEIGALQDAVYPYYSGAKASDVPDDLARKTYLALNFE